jgi:hypothetical protein
VGTYLQNNQIKKGGGVAEEEHLPSKHEP